MRIIRNIKNIPGIYKLSIANHIYIGSSVHLRTRISVHYNTLKKGIHDNTYLQKCVNKYGIDELKYEILITFKEIEYLELLKFEKYYIEYYKADLNLKLDPVTQCNCITTSKEVYEYDLYGNLKKKWPSVNEASRFYNINPSNINVCCVRPHRQKHSCNSLWSYQYPYPYKINLIHVFDLKGNFIKTYANTIDIMELFPNVNRKTILSQLKSRIDSNIPYKNIYLSSDRNFKIPSGYVPKYKDKTKMDEVFETNPIIYVFDRSNNLLYEQHLKDFKDPTYVIRKIKSKCEKYRLSKETKYYSVRKAVIEAHGENGDIICFKNSKQAAIELFNDEKQAKNILKHIKRNTKFRNYLFKRVN